MEGFLGTSAPFWSDFNLIAQITMGAALVVGMFLARSGHIRSHSVVQSAVLFLNLPLITIVMIPSFQTYVYTGLPSQLHQSFYLLPTLMAVAGTAAEALGIYIILVAGSHWIPEGLRFTRYKPWMRTELVLWWSVILLGLATYYVWYVMPAA